MAGCAHHDDPRGESVGMADVGLGASMIEGIKHRGTSGRKTPLPVPHVRRGCQRRAARNLPRRRASAPGGVSIAALLRARAPATRIVRPRSPNAVCLLLTCLVVLQPPAWPAAGYVPTLSNEFDQSYSIEYNIARDRCTAPLANVLKRCAGLTRLR